MQIEKTGRGFGILEFKDCYGIECSLQESSLATEAAIWFGPDHPEPHILVPGKGWNKVALPDGCVINTRMHLTQDQVRELLPLLQHFSETGRLPDAD